MSKATLFETFLRIYGRVAKIGDKFSFWIREKVDMNVVGEASKERFIAAFIDNLFGFAFMIAVAVLIPEGFPVIKFISYILIYFAYFIVFEALWSRTLGKYFQGLIVRKLDGNRCDWKASLIRGVLRLAEVNPILLGGLPAGLIIISSERKQRLGDILAGTVVVSDKTEWNIDNTSSSVPSGEVMILSFLKIPFCSIVFSSFFRCC